MWDSFLNLLNKHFNLASCVNVKGKAILINEFLNDGFQ